MARPEERTNRERLSSWKEIASHLGCDERTCLRWEKKLGLPVHRMEGTPKSRVFAFKDELDRWLNDRITVSGGGPGPDGRAGVLLWGLRIIAAAGGLTAIILAVGRLFLAGASTPSDFRVENSTLVAINDKGRALWRFDTGVSNLRGEDFYRGRFQVKARTLRDAASFPLILIKDIDGDRRTDVLLAVKTQDEFNEDRILRLDDKGSLVWSYEAGRELRFGDAVYARDYRVEGFELHDFNGDGRPEVFFLAYHKPDFPCQFGVLSLEGRLVGEYWNSGYLSDVAFADLDGDGRREILASGLNNEYGKGCLIVFDADRIAGASPQTSPKYLCRELAPGSERAYILFPRTDADLLDYPVETIMTIDPLRNGSFYLNAQVSRVFFEISPALDVVYVHSSHLFQRLHAEAVREGRVRSRLDPDYFERLRRGALYWNGTAWVSERTANLRNVPAGGISATD